jgi:hypothetical protein
MIFAVTEEHDSKKCPLKTDEGVDMLKEMFSEKNKKNHDIKLENAYISCPKNESSTHKGFFTVNSNNIKNVKDFFGRLKVDIKEVVPFNKVI